MIKSFLCTVFVCLSMASCGGERSVSIASNSANSNKVSFGIYDIAKSGPFSNGTESLKGTNSPETRMPGGGGGGGRDEAAFTPTNISLAQTTAASVDTASSDRKIIRNAELDLEADAPEDAQR